MFAQPAPSQLVAPQRQRLAGEIPGALERLVNLESLSLSDNDLTGEIPRALERLVNLESLFLGGNDLTGPILPWLGNLVQLRNLGLDSNDLTGPIPGELASLMSLERLFLSLNPLTGMEQVTLIGQASADRDGVARRKSLISRELRNGFDLERRFRNAADGVAL